MIVEQGKMMNQPTDPIILDPGSCPVSETTSNPLAVSPVAPYVTTGGDGATAGKCHVHVNEFDNCEPETRDLSAEVTIWDVGGNQIGYQSRTEAGATKPLSVNSKLEAPLIVIPQHQNDYVQFSLGSENFNSKQKDKSALSWCSTGGWDPRDDGRPCVNTEEPAVGHLLHWVVGTLTNVSHFVETTDRLLLSMPLSWWQVV